MMSGFSTCTCVSLIHDTRMLVYSTEYTQNRTDNLTTSTSASNKHYYTQYVYTSAQVHHLPC